MSVGLATTMKQEGFNEREKEREKRVERDEEIDLSYTTTYFS